MTIMAEDGKGAGPPPGFATNDLTESPKRRERSEPASLHACARAVVWGPASPTHEQAPVRTLAAASLMMSCDEVYRFTEDTAVHKLHYPLPKLVVLGILAGAYIGFGYSLCCICAGLMSPELRHEQPGLFNFLFGIYGFPTGLMLCVVAGADLYTSNCMYSAVGVWEGRFGLYGWARMLGVSYLSNLAGALLLVGLMAGGGVFSGRGGFVVELAEKKALHLGWGEVLVRGILGNWLVCLAVWQGNMGRDFAGRFIGVWLPDVAFVSLGLEHCIANMFLVPMGMVLGADITVGQFIGRNLIPATLGNLIGGSVLVGTAYACSLGTPGHWIQDSWEHLLKEGGQKWRQRGSGADGRAATGPGAGRGMAGARPQATVQLSSKAQGTASAGALAELTIPADRPIQSPCRRSGAAPAASP